MPKHPSIMEEEKYIKAYYMRNAYDKRTPSAQNQAILKEYLISRKHTEKSSFKFIEEHIFHGTVNCLGKACGDWGYTFEELTAYRNAGVNPLWIAREILAR